jgi:hypothetical protein
MRVTITEGAALACEIVLGRFIQVLAENPDSVLASPEFKQVLVDAQAEVKAARQDAFLFIQREVTSVPVRAPQADLV